MKSLDKVTRLSAINEYENGGLKMIDFETMVKSLRLTWLKRIFGENDGAWKSYIRQRLKQAGGFFLFRCNYDVKDIPITLKILYRASSMVVRIPNRMTGKL